MPVKRFIWVVCLLFCALTLISNVRADFSGYYDPSNWTTTNLNAINGSVTNGAPSFIRLNGGDNGTPDTNDGAGNLDFTITAPAAGAVMFTWLYSSADTLPTFDTAGFLLNGVYTQLATNGQPSVATPFATVINAGDTFGFHVDTLDNAGGRATFTISAFSGPQVGVPELSSVVMIICGGLALLTVNQLRRSRRRRAG